MTGNFVSSTYYYKELPAWAAAYNARHAAARYGATTWLSHKMPDDGVKLFTALESTPAGNELVEEFAEQALSGEQLGTHEATDLLTVSFSSNDYVGHAYGPDSPEAHDTALVTDRLLDKLLRAIDRQVGDGNYLLVFTADHGVAPVPEVNTARKMPGGRIEPAAIKAAVQAALTQKYGPGEWVAGAWDLSLYLNQAFIAQMKLDLGAVEKDAARTILALPHVSRVYTLEEMRNGRGVTDAVSQKVANGFHLRRGPDVELIPDPFWIVAGTSTATTHATPYIYDTHVPVIFLGPAFKPGQYIAPIAVNDIAPTLAALLDIEPPSGAFGRVLTEVLANP